MKTLLQVSVLVVLSSFGLLQLGMFLVSHLSPSLLANQWQATSDQLNLTGEYDSTEENGVFLGKAVKSENAVASVPQHTTVLGDSNDIQKHIEVDLSKQMVYAFENDVKVMEFLISSGKWGRTPTGKFTIQYKTLAQKMSGGSKALGTYYYLPNVQFVQFFGNEEIPWSRGFSFHGTYWHENFGTPMSHGCINMRNEDAQALYYWTEPAAGDKKVVKANKDNPGTTVLIYGEPPAN